MTRQVPWPRIFAEGLAIVVSILLAFGIQAWWEGRQEAALVQRGLSAVRDELAAVRTRIDEDIPFSEAWLNNAEALVATLDSVPGGETVFVSDSVLASMFSVYVADVPTGIVESFISSGRLDAVQNTDLRRSLLEWISLVEDQRDDQARTSEFGRSELRPFLRARFDVQNAQRVEEGTHDPTGSTRVQSDAQFRGLADWQRRWLGIIKNQDHSLREHSTRLDSLIRVELGDP